MIMEGLFFFCNMLYIVCTLYDKTTVYVCVCLHNLHAASFKQGHFHFAFLSLMVVVFYTCNKECLAWVCSSTEKGDLSADDWVLTFEGVLTSEGSSWGRLRKPRSQIHVVSLPYTIHVPICSWACNINGFYVVKFGVLLDTVFHTVYTNMVLTMLSIQHGFI